MEKHTKEYILLPVKKFTAIFLMKKKHFHIGMYNK